ncbi:MAG: hypothetical protein NTX49_03970 [Chlamydiae bacterium]|nr:hypothetical protein [Chlamydiota bacterium]
MSGPVGSTPPRVPVHLPVVRQSNVTGVGAAVDAVAMSAIAAASASSALSSVSAAAIHPVTTLNLRQVAAPGESVTITRATAAKIDKCYHSTMGGGAVRAHGMEPLQHESGVKALQGVVDALCKGEVLTPGLNLSKPNPKFTIDLSRCVISYPVTDAAGNVERKEVSLREEMEKTSEAGKALNAAMEALAVESRGVVGEKGIQPETLLQQCDRNYNKSPALRRSASEAGYQAASAAWKSATTPKEKAAAKKEMEKFKFQSRFPETIAATKAELGNILPETSTRIDAFATRLEKLQGALAHQITAKQSVIKGKQDGIQAKNGELAALSSAATPLDPAATAVKTAKEAELATLKADLATAERELNLLQADQKSLNGVDEFAVTLALAYAPRQGASAADIDKAARELRQAAEGIYGEKYGEYAQTYNKPHYSFFGGPAHTLPYGTDLPAGPGVGSHIVHAASNVLKVTCDALGSWVGWQRVAPDRGLDDAAQYAAQYAGDVGALAYNQMTNSADERMHYASYCADQNIALAQQGITDHVLSAFYAAEGKSDSSAFLGRLLPSIGSRMTPADSAAIQAEMDRPVRGTPPVT